MSDPRDRRSVGAIASLAALTLLGEAGGWLVLLGGGYHHQRARFSPATTFVDGPAALAVAAIFLAMSAIGVAALVQAMGGATRWRVLGAALALAPPAAFVLSGGYPLAG